MDTDDDLCPSLSQNDDVGISTDNRSVGTLVQFMCSKEGFELMGPRVLYCMANRAWNGTTPYCSSVEDLSTPNVTYTEEPTGYDVNNGGLQIDTVVIILWSTGGVLLLTLIVLMACILRSTKKSRRTINRANIFRGRNPHGGVNPTFTSYDEIWTWIPVVTESQNNCTSQIYPSTRENRSSNELSVSTVPLPSYENVVRQTDSRLPRNSAQTSANPCANNTTNANHYETIPADVIQTNLPTSGGATSVAETRPSNSLSALMTAALQSPLPERRSEPVAQRGHSCRQHGRRGENRNRRSAQPTHEEELRQRSQNIYRQYNSRTRSPRIVERNPGFTHSDRSMFSYYGENGRQIFCDIPPGLWDEETLPPYNNNNYQSQNGNRPLASAPMMRLEYDYF